MSTAAKKRPTPPYPPRPPSPRRLAREATPPRPIGLEAPLRRGECRCAGCRDLPWPACAACGEIAIIALRDDDFEHSMPLCRSCLQIILDCRGIHLSSAEPSTSYEAERSRRRRERETAEKKRRYDERKRERERELVVA